MDISGTLHLYSGDRRELFFVFDDDVAQELMNDPTFDLDDKETRRVQISVGKDRFIHQRTLSFSKKQTEIKVSLCAKNSSDGLLSLTQLYQWFVPDEGHPAPFAIVGELHTANVDGEDVLELWLKEGIDPIEPTALLRRRKRESRTRISFEKRRLLQETDLSSIGRRAEEVAIELIGQDYPDPKYATSWRNEYLDSEFKYFREHGIIADIDVWDNAQDVPVGCIEVKAQKVSKSPTTPVFYLSSAEQRSWKRLRELGFKYEVWLLQYRDIDDFVTQKRKIDLLVFETIREEWCEPETLRVRPDTASCKRFDVNWQ